MGRFVGGAPAMVVGTAAALAMTACSFEASTRSDFSRDVPLADGGPGTPIASGWRATSFVVSAPSGLAGFQSDIIEPAVERENLNFIIAVDDGDPGGGPWSSLVGSADAAGGANFRWKEGYPPEPVPAETREGAVSTQEEFSFWLVAEVPYEIAIPLAAAEVTATRTEDGAALKGGVLSGVIPGEEAATSLIDLQNDGETSNDSPLLVFLGEPDTDLDGDGTVDDFAARADFEAAEVTIVR